MLNRSWPRSRSARVIANGNTVAGCPPTLPVSKSSSSPQPSARDRARHERLRGSATRSGPGSLRAGRTAARHACPGGNRRPQRQQSHAAADRASTTRREGRGQRAKGKGLVGRSAADSFFSKGRWQRQKVPHLCPLPFALCPAKVSATHQPPPHLRAPSPARNARVFSSSNFGSRRFDDQEERVLAGPFEALDVEHRVIRPRQTVRAPACRRRQRTTQTGSSSRTPAE